MASKKNHLRLVTQPTVQGFGVVGVEEDAGKVYFAPFGPFATGLEALQYRGAARDLHNYQAYQAYHAVILYSDDSVHEISYLSLNSFEVDPRPMTQIHNRFPLTPNDWGAIGVAKKN